MIKRIVIVGVIMFLSFLLLMRLFSMFAYPHPYLEARWDFTHGRSLPVVGWPTDPVGAAQDWFVPHSYTYKKITIVLPGHPELVSIGPSDVFAYRVGNSISVIKVNEEPLTQEQALERLRSLAKVWGWRWDETAYTKWKSRVLQNDTSSIGAGNAPNSDNVPNVCASINDSPATPDRPWYVQIYISWQDADLSPAARAARDKQH